MDVVWEVFCGLKVSVLGCVVQILVGEAMPDEATSQKTNFGVNSVLKSEDGVIFNI